MEICKFNALKECSICKRPTLFASIFFMYNPVCSEKCLWKMNIEFEVAEGGGRVVWNYKEVDEALDRIDAGLNKMISDIKENDNG